MGRVVCLQIGRMITLKKYVFLEYIDQVMLEKLMMWLFKDDESANWLVVFMKL